VLTTGRVIPLSIRRDMKTELYSLSGTSKCWNQGKELLDKKIAMQVLPYSTHTGSMASCKDTAAVYLRSNLSRKYTATIEQTNVLQHKLAVLMHVVGPIST